MEDRRYWFSKSLSSRGMYSEWLRAQVKVWTEQKPCCWSVISVWCLLCTTRCFADGDGHRLLWKDGSALCLTGFLVFFLSWKICILLDFSDLERSVIISIISGWVDDCRCRLTCTFPGWERASFVCPRLNADEARISFPTCLSVRFRHFSNK
jgi:hypothetical protein